MKDDQQIAKSPRPSDRWWRREGVPGLLVCIFVAAYLIPFVRRGWIPHDEGTLGLDAVRVLTGELPHVGFQDPYTGALSWIYAGLFRLFGVDVQWTRWLLYVVALIATAFSYAIARRFAAPYPAAAVAALTIFWGFPNYFSGVPSWWHLLGSLIAIYCLFRHLDSGQRRWLVLAGMSVGVCFTIKQTGVYLFAALGMAIAIAEQSERPLRGAAHRKWGSFSVRSIGLLVLVGAVSWLVARAPVETWLRLVLPIFVIAVVLVCDEWRRAETGTDGRLRRLASDVFAAAGGALVPIAILLGPYIYTNTLDQWLYGAFVLPQARHASGALVPPRLTLSLGAVPATLYCVSWLAGHASTTWAKAMRIVSWLVFLSALGAVGTIFGYQVLWNGLVAGISVVVVLGSIVSWRLLAVSANGPELYVLAIFAAFLGFYQFPFSAPIYACFAFPVAILLLVGLFRRTDIASKPTSAVVLIALALFSLGSLNRGYVINIGLVHLVPQLDAALAVPHASITTTQADAEQYRKMVATVARAGAEPRLHAFPDCPEVYLLTGARNPTPFNFEFFAPRSDDQVVAFWADHAIDVLVINHRPNFSGTPSAGLLGQARQLFPHGSRSGKFEVRWK